MIGAEFDDLGVGLGGTTGDHGLATRHHEGAHELAVGGVPEPVADLGVERLVFALLIGSHAVVEAKHLLNAIVDRAERLEFNLFAVRGFDDLANIVVVRNVDALIAFP
ncbi:unannotated protein [freshwater metagenome]|uniref:Unannotated protein n=1 Tax=freshwater metagenome TaxID=449393 RepID=A0A6J6HZW0_9ZZZZ